jgi:hypothetical protein
VRVATLLYDQDIGKKSKQATKFIIEQYSNNNIGSIYSELKVSKDSVGGGGFTSTNFFTGFHFVGTNSDFEF